MADAMNLRQAGDCIEVEGAGPAGSKGLLTRVVADDALEAEAAAMVERIAAGAPLTARWHKRLAKQALRPEISTAEDWREPLLPCETADYREGIRAFLAKEKPTFGGK
ncbi:enoyl-CoA hydratase-related protein [Pelagibius sp. 7325]|uniref:enoyl-CoA hydratase-related protein n=1 Tax=Pelagibius sp. 7325 TaxID=3131994 RepID=UPI0030EF63A3